MKTKRKLLVEARKCHLGFKYAVQELADKFSNDTFSIKILFLPVAHPELNPMEMVWGTVKRAVASLNSSFNLGEVEQLKQKGNLESILFKNLGNLWAMQGRRRISIDGCRLFLMIWRMGLTLQSKI